MRGVLLGFLALLASATSAGARVPPVYPWQEAERHVGEFVTLDGVVAAASTTGDTCVLEFAPDDPHALRVIVVLPMLSGLPAKPERLYVGKRVRASGLVRRFAGRPEMVLRGLSQIEVVDVGGPPSTPPQATAPVAPPEVEKPPSRGLVPAIARQLAAAAPCERARARWRDAASTAGELSTALGRCLEGGGYRCHRESAALAPALTALESAEQQIDAACP